ncbi:L-threonylcarbamoyladenylate synthase, partial [bacterium]|nr:L-threonylcarbamoyladenylate synthase [bacterium]
KKALISDQVTAGLSSLGVRVPRHPIARALLEASQVPVAAPSANRSLYISPTTAAHVRECLGDEVFLIDGGPSQVGLESTIVELNEEGPVTILRYGSVTKEVLEESIGEEVSLPPQRQTKSDAVALRAPGQLEKHYSPRTPLRFLPKELTSLSSEGKNVAIVTFTTALREHLETALSFSPAIVPLSQGGEPEENVRNLYHTLRSLDTGRFDLIWIESPPEGKWHDAVLDRLNRATH